MIIEPKNKNISKIIPPNYSTWQTIELSYLCAKDVISRGVEGSFVECGVATGNNLAAMCYAGRFGVGFDSFVGIPYAGVNDTEQPGLGAKDETKHGILESSGITVHGQDQVVANFDKWGISNYTLIEGWFQNTVHEYDQDIAVLRLDGDLYESTIVCLEHLYPKLSKGGIMIIDDWNLDGCRKAFYDYFMNKTLPKLILDNGITYWEK